MFVGRWFILSLGLIFAVGPVYWMVSSSLKSNSELGLINPTWFPRTPTFTQFAVVLQSPGFVQSLATSAVIAAVTTAVVLVFGSAAAYAVTHWKFPGSDRFALLTLFTQLLPQAAVVVPVYLLWSSLGIAGSAPGLAVSYFAVNLPIAVWMLIGFFRTIPIELTEAGLIDGASRIRVLMSIVLPIARPALAAVGVLTILNCWGEFLFALVLLTGNTSTITVNIASLIGEHNANIGPLMAASVIATIPPLVVFFVLQKHFVAGLTGGAVKS